MSTHSHNSFVFTDAENELSNGEVLQSGEPADTQPKAKLSASGLVPPAADVAKNEERGSDAPSGEPNLVIDIRAVARLMQLRAETKLFDAKVYSYDHQRLCIKLLALFISSPCRARNA